jgi:hypothetical protein
MLNVSGVGGISEECEETERMMLNLLEKWSLFMPEISYVYILFWKTCRTTKGVGTESAVLDQYGPLYCGFRYSIS